MQSAANVTTILFTDIEGSSRLWEQDSQKMSKALAQTVVIINKPGAAGTLGLIELSRAAPDGYTLALTPNNPLTAQPHVQKLPYNMDSFRYVCLTYFAPYVLIAGPQAPFKTFDEFVGFAKAKRENLVYGHAGVASQPHLGMLAVLMAIGAEGLGVPFTGAGPMAQALLSGTVMAITETPAGPATLATSAIAVICGTPTPAMMRVVQIDPGPMPTLTPSAPAWTRSLAASAVAMLPAMIGLGMPRFFSSFTVSMTFFE